MLDIVKQKSSRVAETDISDAFQTFANPLNSSDSPQITLIRPSSIFSAKSYSAPLTPPIGIAYIAAALERAR